MGGPQAGEMKFSSITCRRPAPGAINALSVIIIDSNYHLSITLILNISSSVDKMAPARFDAIHYIGHRSLASPVIGDGLVHFLASNYQ